MTVPPGQKPAALSPQGLPPAGALGRDERGVAAIEAALAFPFMLLMAVGLFEYGNALYQTELMQTGVREAARYLARTPTPATMEAAARNLATTGSVAGDRLARVKGWSGTDIQVSYEALTNPRDQATGLRPYRSGDQVMVVRVSTTLPYRGFGLLRGVGLRDFSLAATHEERIIGQ